MRQLRRLFLALLALAVPALAGAQQQQATITGRVMSEAGAPLGSVNVFIENMGVATLTRTDGTYALTIPAGRFQANQEVIVTAQLIGYRASAVTARLTPGGTVQQDFTLGLDPLRRAEIVATGVGTAARAERLGTARASVDAQAVVRANEPNVIQALAGKVPNVITNQQTGD